MAGRSYLWDAAKDDWLKRVRGFGFGEIVEAARQGKMLGDVPHHSDRYPHQRLLIVQLGDEAVVVPYIRSGKVDFLKTAYPSRKMRRRYLGK